MFNLIEDSWILISASAFNLHIKIHIHYGLLSFISPYYQGEDIILIFWNYMCGIFLNLCISFQDSKEARLNICYKKGGYFVQEDWK